MIFPPQSKHAVEFPAKTTRRIVFSINLGDFAPGKCSPSNVMVDVKTEDRRSVATRQLYRIQG